METKVIAKFENAEYGIRADVAESSKGYSVALFDLDAEQYVDQAKIYPFTMKGALDADLAYAQFITEA